MKPTSFTTLPGLIRTAGRVIQGDGAKLTGLARELWLHNARTQARNSFGLVANNKASAAGERRQRIR